MFLFCLKISLLIIFILKFNYLHRELEKKTFISRLKCPFQSTFFSLAHLTRVPTLQNTCHFPKICCFSFNSSLVRLLSCLKGITLTDKCFLIFENLFQISLLLQRFSLLSQAVNIPNLGISLTVFAVGLCATTAKFHPQYRHWAFLYIRR